MRSFSFFILIFGLIALSGHSLQAQEINSRYIGSWEGELKVAATSLRIWLHIQEDNTGLKASMDSPDQGAMDLPVGKISAEGEILTIELPDLRASFKGSLKNDSLLSGTWSQGLSSLPLLFHKSAKKLEILRPQTPQEPFPYTSEEVEFYSADGKLKFSGTLTKPIGSVNVPALILVSGSGPQDRDCQIMGHKPFWVLADFFSRNGIAVLRYDERGVGKSQGNFQSATSFDFTKDAYAAVDFLKSVEGITQSMVGMIGHSEGGAIVPMVAASRDDLAFAILLAGPASTGKEILLQQTEEILRLEGSDPKEIKATLATNLTLYDISGSDLDFQSARNEILKLYQKRSWYMSKKQRARKGLDENSANQVATTVLSDWFRAFVKYDPSIVLKKLNLPVLALFGSKDCQVLPNPNADRMKEYLTAGGNKKVEVIVVEGVNHLFQNAETGKISEYGQIEETFAPEVMNLMLGFIQKSCRIRN